MSIDWTQYSVSQDDPEEDVSEWEQYTVQPSKKGFPQKTAVEQVAGRALTGAKAVAGIPGELREIALGAPGFVANLFGAPPRNCTKS